jgi:Protein of unknown function (DUF3293)
MRSSLTMPPALLRAYRETCYEAAGVKVRVGRRSVGSDQLLVAHRARAAAFVTAYNPCSRIMPVGWNQRMQIHLRQALRRRHVVWGRGTLRRWSEVHLLVFDDPAPISRLARRFRQHGIVIVRRGQPARLVFAL